jgi:lysylphosphatidylglycerol synthetase-like protein (DUF2156 family)
LSASSDLGGLLRRLALLARSALAELFITKELGQSLPALALLPLLFGIDISMDRAVIQDALLSVVGALSVRLRPVETIKLAVAFTTWTCNARQERLFLHEELVTVSTFHPSVVGCGK